MKKLSLILVLLLAFGFGAFAEPMVSGTLGSQLSFDDDADLGNIGKLRLNVSFPVGDFVTVVMDIRDDTNGDDYFTFNQVYATTDLSGIFGIDAVMLKLTMGNYEEWIANWNSPTSTNRARAVEYFAIGGPDSSPDAGLDIGVGAFGTIKAYLETTEGSDVLGYKFGFILGPVVEGLNAAVSYSGSDGVSYMKAEAGYTLAIGDGMSLYIPVGFLMNLEGETMKLGVGAKFTGFGLSLGVGGLLCDERSGDLTFDVLDLQLAYAVMDTGLTVYVNMFANPGGWYAVPLSDPVVYDEADDFIESIDFGISYNLAGNMMYVGYVADLGDDVTTSKLMMDDSDSRHGIVGSGFYVVSRISF
jgi:hypothetical protein